MSSESPTSSSKAPSSTEAASEFEALQAVIAALRPLPEETRVRILEAVSAFLQVSPRPQSASRSTRPSDADYPSSGTRVPFSEDTSMSPKDFLFEKQPRTDVERIACLAYYLTHYRGTQHFKTLDLSMLNTEAAQPKFANTAYSSNNAVKRGYLVPSTKGQRQLSAVGERFVRALPDRAAARAAIESLRRKHRTKRSLGSSSAQKE